MQLCFVLSTDTNPEALGGSERKQRLHVYDRLSQGDLHVSSWRNASDPQRLHRNVEPGTSWIDRVRQLCDRKILPTRRLEVHGLRGWKVLADSRRLALHGLC